MSLTPDAVIALNTMHPKHVRARRRDIAMLIARRRGGKNTRVIIGKLRVTAIKCQGQHFLYRLVLLEAHEIFIQQDEK